MAALHQSKPRPASGGTAPIQSRRVCAGWISFATRKTDVIAPSLTNRPWSLRGSKNFWTAETRTRQKLRTILFPGKEWGSATTNRVNSVSDAQAPATVDRRELLERIGALRADLREEIGAAALMAEPTKTCARRVSDLLDSLNGLEVLLRR
jgi:hypothetical protein